MNSKIEIDMKLLTRAIQLDGGAEFIVSSILKSETLGDSTVNIKVRTGVIIINFDKQVFLIHREVQGEQSYKMIWRMDNQPDQELDVTQSQIEVFLSNMEDYDARMKQASKNPNRISILKTMNKLYIEKYIPLMKQLSELKYDISIAKQHKIKMETCEEKLKEIEDNLLQLEESLGETFSNRTKLCREALWDNEDYKY